MLRRGEKRRLRMDDPLGDSDTPPLTSPQSPMDQQSSDMEWEESCVPVQQSREAKSSNQLQNTTVETNCNGQITQSLRRQTTPVRKVRPSSVVNSQRNSPENTIESTPSPAPPRRRHPLKNYVTEQYSVHDDSSLFGIIRNGKSSSIQGTVDEWIEQYKNDRNTGLLAIMQFFISASGCRGKLTSEMLNNVEYAAIIRQMTEEFDEVLQFFPSNFKENGEYPIMMSGPQWKKFRSNFCDFVHTLVKKCQYSIIYDQYLMDNVISLLTGLSDSQVRAFRHTATLAAVKVMTALVDVALILSINLDNTFRQYEVERQKTRDIRATDRLEALLEKRKELEENMDEIKNMLTYTFKSVFVHRYRDTVPEIRGICMAELGIWMQRFPQHFLDDSCLKYIGWNLFDKDGDVRLKCLQALQPLYASEKLKGKLELFTSKFKDRIVSMILDKQLEVAVQAVHLIIIIQKYQREILSDKDCENVYELVFSKHQAVAQAAGEFLNERLFKLDETTPALRTRRGKKRLPHTPLVRDLVQFFIESEFHEHGAYFVDSLIDSNEMMKDWECMTDLLLENPGPSEESLNDLQEVSLIELMTCCIKQAATGEPPIGRLPTRKTTIAKGTKQAQDDRVRLTEHYIHTLPLLIEKYIADPEKIANLLIIPQYFNLEIYTTSRQEKSLEELLRLIQIVVERHTEREVLENCAKTLEVLCTEHHAIYSRCDVIRSTVIDLLVNNLSEVLNVYETLNAAEEEPNKEEEFALVSSLKKVAIFHSCHNLGPWTVWEILFTDIQDHIKSMPPEAIKYCISTCHDSILWELNQLENSFGRETSAAQQLKQLRKHLDAYLLLMIELINTSTVAIFREEAYTSVCDLLIVFSKKLGDNPLLRPLVYQPNLSLQHTLNNFIQTYVFVEQENDDQIVEELHKRRCHLTGFCKLVVYNVLPIKAAADVFKHYVKHSNYCDIIKKTMGTARDMNRVSCARTMALSLAVLFRDLIRDDGDRIDRQSHEFLSVKELAKRFALSFGLDSLKNREAISALHRDVIIFAANPLKKPDDPTGPPRNLAFLEIGVEFSSKLLKQDKKTVLEFLDRILTMEKTSGRGEEWQSLLLYRNSLVQSETGVPPQTARRASRRRRDQAGEHADHNDDAESDEDTVGY